MGFEGPFQHKVFYDDNALHVEHKSIWSCNICQLRAEERKVPRLQLLKHTLLSGSRVGMLY